MLSDNDYSVMELFILAVISKGGLDNISKLRMVGVSLGGSRTALDRLQAKGLLERSAPGKRRERKFKVTPAGEYLLHKKWKTAAYRHDQLQADFESLLRAFGLVMAMQTHIGAEIELLKIAARMRKHAAEDLAKKAQRQQQQISNFVSTYRWLVTFCRTRQLASEAAVLGELSVLLPTRGEHKATEYRKV
jgi:DNA-binding PadR family transcriptional regulator